MIHVIGDILQSIGVLIAALLIYIFGDKKDKDGIIYYLISKELLFLLIGSMLTLYAPIYLVFWYYSQHLV